MRYHARRSRLRTRATATSKLEDLVPLCVYLCYTPGCNTKVERWMMTPEEGTALKLECPRCGVVMECAWTGAQTPTPNLKDVPSVPRLKP